MKQRLIIFPCNGNALEAVDCVGDEFQIIGFVDDDPKKIGATVNGLQVFSRQAFLDFEDAKVLAVPGSPSSFMNRKSLIESLQISENRFAKVIHRNATVSKHASIGHNVLIMAGVVITTNVRISNHICVLPNTVIHHDVSIDDYTLIGSGVVVAGHVTIEENSYIGSGSNVINNITIGRGAMIGLGSNVIKNVNPNSKNVGNPSREI